MFLIIDSRETLSLAHEHAVRLKGDAASDLSPRASRKRRSPVSRLRRHACRCQIDTAPLAQRPV